MEEMNMEIQDQEKREEHVTYMKKRAEDSRRQSSHCSPTIYKVPLTLRQSDKAAYEPRIISIGPYHRCRRGKKWLKARKRLRAMESHKWRYLHDFLSRNPHRTLDDYFKEVEKWEERARGCYSEKILLSRLEFTEVMVLDGCFVIELFLKKFERDQANDDPDDDPVYSHSWVWDCVFDDLLLFENQLPFFILDSLYGIHQTSRESPPLVQISLNFFSPILEWKFGTGLKDLLGSESAHHTLLESESVHHLLESESVRHNLLESESVHHLLDSESVHHLLHLVHYHLFSPLIPSLSSSPPTCCTTRLLNNIWECCKKLVDLLKNLLSFFQNNIKSAFQMINRFCIKPFRKAELLPTHTWPKSSDPIIPSATRLKGCGITFSNRKVPESPSDITFNPSNGKMEIPSLCVDDGTNSFFRNLAAFEQCIPSAGGEFTSYISFMDGIVNTAQDVEILGSHGIIENMLGSDEEVALLFNRMCKDILIGGDTQISQVIKDAKAYSETNIHVQRATLMRDYFGSPWSIISVLAAAFLILVALINTILAFLSYFQGSS